MRTLLLTGLLIFVFHAQAEAGRYEDLTSSFAKGPKAEVVAATYFGTAGVEEFVSAVELDNGRIMAFGNAWGPQIPGGEDAIKLGSGKHTGSKSITQDRRKRDQVNTASPDRSGVIVWYSPGLKAIERVIRFDWGVATIEDAILLDDQSVILVGQGGPNAASIKLTPGAAYVAVMNQEGIKWIKSVEGSTAAANRAWLDKHDRIYFRIREGGRTDQMWRVKTDGSEMKKLAQNGTGNAVSNFHGINTQTGEFYYGGDRNTNTGKEPWRQPFMYVYSPEGEKTKTIWEWRSRSLREKGYPAYGQVSDSSVRFVATHPVTGNLVISGWSDGGNSVFTHQPTDISERTSKPANGLSTWGMKNANSLAYIMRIDPKDWKMQSWSYWVSYVPDTFNNPRYRGAPNNASITDLTFLSDASVAFAGSAATGLLQTPGAFFEYKKDGEKHGGEFVTIMTPDLTGLYFSSYLPGCEEVRVRAGRNGRLLVVSRSKGVYDHPNGKIPSPVKNAVQSQKAGPYDAHIILLQVPTAK